MDALDLQLDDVVLFELPTRASSDALAARLRSRWPGWSEADDPVWLVAAELQGGEGELAQLLREAQAVLAELDLPYLRFCIDGRVYTLEAAPQESGAAAPLA